jgi:hypothetical protein
MRAIKGIVIRHWKLRNLTPRFTGAARQKTRHQRGALRATLCLSLAIPQDLTGGFILPVSPLLHGPVESYGAGTGAIINATAAVPAFVGVQDNRGLAFLMVGNIDIHLTDFHAMVTTVTDFSMKNHRRVRGGYIG